MTEYRYLAVAPDGTKVKDVAEGVSASAVENELARRGLVVRRISEKKSILQFELTKQRVPRAEIMHFSRQLSAFVKAGIPIIDALQVVLVSTKNERFELILTEVIDQVQAGAPLSEAIAVHRDAFPPYYLGILRSAEITGNLDVVLDQLSSYIERDLEAASKIKSALAYPLVIMGMSVVTVFIMAIFVLPKFVGFFKNLGATLPLPTRMLLAVSDFLGNWWWLLLLIVVGFAAVFIASGRTDRGLEIRHSTMLKLPLVGTIVQYAAVERFCRIIGAMMRAGVALPEAMSSAIESTNNKVFEGKLREAREAMLQGEGIARPIAETGLFPPAAVQMIRVGEDTGSLDMQVEAASDYYGRELEMKLKRLTTLFEPAVIIGMGGIVGFVALALVSAMYGAFSQVKQ